jgi:nucleotide-binding universal stress UspA family protein
MASEPNQNQRKVLIAVDMGHYSEEAFNLYVNEIHKPGTEVICFHTIDRPSITDEGDYAQGVARDAVFDGCNEHAIQVQEKFNGKMKEHNINGRTMSLIRHKTGDAIVEAAKAEGATLIVMGTRGLNPVKRVALGSVSDHVLHHAHCPVIIASASSQMKIERRRSSNSFSRSFSSTSE